MQEKAVQNLAGSSPFVHLDVARGLAALAVVFGHLRSFVFISYGELKSPGIVDTVVWTATGVAHQAVTVFFVLSGFFISRSILLDDAKGGFSWPIYLIKRLSRLWTVLVPCLIATLLCDRIGIALAGSQFYDGQLFGLYSSGPTVATGGASLDPLTFLGNVLFLQDILVPTFGSNGPLWSLSYEFWYYMMFPLMYLGVRRLGWLTAINLVILILLILFVGKDIAMSGVIWLGGAFSYIAYEKRWGYRFFRNPLTMPLGAGLFILSVIWSKSGGNPTFYRDLPVGIATVLLVSLLAARQSSSLIYHKFGKTIAEASYSIYLVHFPFLALLAAGLLHYTKFSNSITGYLVFLGLGTVTLSYCFSIYWLFERNTGRVRRYCMGKYLGRIRGHSLKTLG
jgi:peptidoglycan/LPS O-acetylase OafA/YrhL